VVALVHGAYAAVCADSWPKRFARRHR